MTDENGTPVDRTPLEAASVDGEPKPDAPIAASIGQSMAEAARKAGLGAVADGEQITPGALLGAMGGVRGIIEAVLPGLVFLLTYSLTTDPDAGQVTLVDLIPSLVAPVAVGLALAVARFIQRQPATQAFGGLVGIVICAGLVLITGRAQDYYVPGFWLNGAYAAGLLLSVVVGWPLVGLAVGFLMGDGIAWRTNRLRRRVLTWTTVLWAAVFAARDLVQIPLFFAGNTEALGVTRLIMGVPLYGLLIIATWLIVRSIYPHGWQHADDTAEGSDAS